MKGQKFRLKEKNLLMGQRSSSQFWKKQGAGLKNIKRLMKFQTAKFRQSTTSATLTAMTSPILCETKVLVGLVTL